MSKNKIRRPKKSMPTPAPPAPTTPKPELGTDPESLVAEYQGLDVKLGQINQIIKNSTEQQQKLQAQVANARSEGQTVLGQLNVLVRILNGMGIDPNNYKPIQAVEDEEIPVEKPGFSGEDEKNEAEVVDIKRDVTIEAIRRRLRR